MYDIKLLKKLREETGVSFSLCKKALEESKNDMTKAKKVLTSWGADKAADKAGRKTGSGAIFAYVHHNKQVAAMAEIACETDFVSGNKEFQTLGQEIAMQVASLKPEKIENLLSQEYIRDPSKKISDLIKDAVLKFGENIQIKKIIFWTV